VTTRPLLQPVRFPALLAAVLGTVLLVGCSGKRQAAVPPRPVEKIAVRVTNHHFLDVVVYAVCEGQRTRIGVASGSGSTQMNVPRRLLGPGQEVQLIGDAIGSEERAVTETIIVQPGQFIELLLESRLARSSVGVY
jgi:hypothetical protein